jgi:hypothetical protein
VITTVVNGVLLVSAISSLCIQDGALLISSEHDIEALHLLSAVLLASRQQWIWIHAINTTRRFADYRQQRTSEGRNIQQCCVVAVGLTVGSSPSQNVRSVCSDGGIDCDDVLGWSRSFDVMMYLRKLCGSGGCLADKSRGQARCSGFGLFALM